MRESATNTDNARTISLQRAEELKRDAERYLLNAANIYTSIDNHLAVEQRKESILDLLNGSEEDWQDWKWQMRNRIKDAALLGRILGLSQTEVKQINRVGRFYRWAISPYYLSLMEANYHTSPIYRQAVPDILELIPGGTPDPMQEERTSPAARITRRYPDRLIINVTNQCAMFCRHCQRRRNIGEYDVHAATGEINEALEYIAANHEIRDVLITGGDALLLSDAKLEWILSTLKRIPHVEIVRLGTRTPVTLPQRITPELCNILQAYPPIYLNTQFNHPLEISNESKLACDRLVSAGVILGNQSVLLRGINDDAVIIRKLNQELLKIRVRPYYLFQVKEVSGTGHWRCRLEKGMQFMEEMRGHTSGLAVPTYIINAPRGKGKIPLMPGYIIAHEKKDYFLRTWEGEVIQITDDL
ncbi:MAG: KamA family radical SAM protein [Syntrophomonadaceae bacterium]|nr:KamA family radical SAM protein [Syntrophomonadaceae bacterium]